MKLKKTRILIFALLLAMTFGAGCKPKEPVNLGTPENASKSEFNMLDTVEMDQVDATLVVTGIGEIDDEYMLEDGEKIISPWVYVKNTGNEPFDIAYSPYVLVDSDGTEYAASFYTPGNLYSGVTVLPGGLIEGPVYFVVPDEAQASALKAPPDLYWGTVNMVQIGLQDYAEEPDMEVFTAEFVDYYEDSPIIELNTPCNYDEKLSVTVTDAYFLDTDELSACDSYAFFQVAITVDNLTDEELGVTLDYEYKLYSPEYNHLLNQIPLPIDDNEMWVETLAAGESGDFVLTYEVKADASEMYLFVQDLFGDYVPVFLSLQ